MGVADLPLTSLRSPSNKSDNKPVPFASLRSLILLLSSIELRLFDSLRSHNKSDNIVVFLHRINVRKRVKIIPHLRKRVKIIPHLRKRTL